MATFTLILIIIFLILIIILINPQKSYTPNRDKEKRRSRMENKGSVRGNEEESFYVRVHTEIEKRQKTKQKGRNENYVKGMIAEVIIEQLFITAGHKIEKYGIEYYPNLMKKLKGLDKNSQESYDLRNRPDFIVRNKDTGKPFLVEAKFRGDGEFSSRSLNKKLFL